MASTISAGTTTTTALVYSADTSGVLQLQTNGGTTALTLDTSQNATFAGKVASASSLQLATNGTTTAVTIDTSQNVGLGVTPSAWKSTSKALQVGTTASIKNESGFTALGDNYYTNSSNQNIYVTTAASSVYYQTGGTHVWLNAPSGTAGTAISFSQAMTLDASSNLLVGTTSTAFSEKFNVTQSANQKAGLFFNTNASFTNNVLNLRASRNTTNSSYGFLQCSIDGVADKLYIYDSGNVVNANNSYGSISDIKLKENIVDATPKLDDLMKVKVRNYNLKADPTHKQLGVIAQELGTVFPAMVEETPDRDKDGNDLGTTTKSVKYSVFVPMLIKAIQELSAQVTTLQTQVTALKG